MFRSRRRVEIYEFGPFRLDLGVRRLLLQDKPVSLSARTFDILRILVENAGRIVTKELLLKRVWPNQYVEENNLTVRVSGLRKTLGESVENRFIETVSGLGYRFVAKVREVSADYPGPQDEAFNSLAVLPLTNADNQQRLNYLCDGITESLINSLSQLTGLRVMSRSTVFRYRAGDVDALAAGRDLGVQAVLVGELNQVSGSILISLEMVDVDDGAQLWGATYRRQSYDIFSLQGEIAREVSDSLRIKLSKVEEQRITKRQTDDSEAYHLYLKGRYFWNKRTPSGVKRSIEYYMRAIRRDPKYALAYSGLAEAYETMSRYGFTSPWATMPKARAAASSALEIDDQLAEAHVSLGIIKSAFEWDWRGAESAFRRALELSPNSAAAHQYYATLLIKLVRLDEAVAEIRRAFNLDPLSAHIHLAFARALYFAKKYDMALEHCRQILELEPTFWPANALIGLVYLEQENYEGAIRKLKKAVSFSESYIPISRKKSGSPRAEASWLEINPEAIGFLGYAYARNGQSDEAINIVNRLMGLTKKRYVEPYALALVHVGLKDNDAAFYWLEQALAERSNMVTYFKVWSFFRLLSNDPRYRELIRRIGF